MQISKEIVLILKTFYGESSTGLLCKISEKCTVKSNSPPPPLPPEHPFFLNHHGWWCLVGPVSHFPFLCAYINVHPLYSCKWHHIMHMSLQVPFFSLIIHLGKFHASTHADLTHLFVCLAAPGLRCRTRDLQSLLSSLWHLFFVFILFFFLVATCRIS